MQDIIGFDPGISIFWIWLNFTGFFFTVVIAYLVSYFSTETQNNAMELERPKFSLADFNCKESYILIGFFVFILALCAYLPQIFS